MKICLNEYNELIVCEQISKMKHLISSNPCALLSETDSININKIARDRTNSVLLPWIATNFQWALDDPNNSSPLFDLLGLHVRSLGVHECTVTATTIRQLLEVYPRGLVQADKMGYTWITSCEVVTMNARLNYSIGWSSNVQQAAWQCKIAMD